MISMIKNLNVTILILIGVISFLSNTSTAQNESPVIIKSDQKIIYQGKIYFIHKVAQGNTLYSICKTYQVTLEDIRKANPSAILDPLAIGQILRIPETSESKSIEKIISLYSVKENEDFIFHKVQSGETTFSIHKKYNIPLAAIFKYNPGSENSIATGQILKIPKEHLLKPQVTEGSEKQEEPVYYTVQQGDTLYRIAKDYGVSVSALINTNESLRWGLKTGQVITIPPMDFYYATDFDISSDSMLLVTGLAKFTQHQCDSIFSAYKMRTPVKVALALPFFTDERYSIEMSAEQDTIDSEEIHKKQNGFRGRVAVELYEGLLLAIDSLKKRDIDINLFVYDTKADTNQLKKILGDLEIVQPDLIIGPFLRENIALMNKFSTEKKIPFIPPLMKDDSTLRHNPNLFQVIPSHQDELEIWSEYIAQYRKKNIFFIYKRKLFEQNESEQLKTILLKKLHDIPDQDTLLFHEVLINDSLQANLNKYLSDTIENIIIVASSYEPEVSDILTKVHFLHKSYKTKVFGLPAWQKFKSIRIDHFHDLNVTLYSPFYIDYSDPLVKSFVKKCRSTLKYEPFMTTSKGTGINYTFLGYDLGMYFIPLRKNYSESACDCAGFYHPELLLSGYSFRRNRIFGYNENVSISVVKYTENIDIKRKIIEGE